MPVREGDVEKSKYENALGKRINFRNCVHASLWLAVAHFTEHHQRVSLLGDTVNSWLSWASYGPWRTEGIDWQGNPIQVLRK